MPEVMWLVRGVQSAIFYYVACTPCTDVKYRRKRKKEAVQALAAREALENEQPHIISQPLPFSTNIHWGEEVAKGPGPPTKRGHGPREPVASRTGSRKGMGSSGKESATGATSAEVVISGNGHALPLSSNTMELAGIGRIDSSRHQREDEELWGELYNVNRPERHRRTSHRREGSSVGLPGRGRADTGGSNKYYITPTPIVTDLYPANTGRQPLRRYETKWMLQPPPRAKVMEGKEPVSSRNRSRGSTLRQDEGEEKAVDRTTGRTGDDSPTADSPVRTSDEQDFALGSVHGQQHDKDRPRKRKPYDLAIPSKNSSPQDLDSTLDSTSFPRRPPLATTKSTSDMIPQLRSFDQLEAAFATSPLSSDSTLTSRTPSPLSSKIPFDHDHPDTNFPNSGSGKLDDVYYWGGNEFKLSGKVRKNSNENGKLAEAPFGIQSEGNGTMSTEARFWRWSMDF
jgi:hypothetical protein